MSTEGAAGAMRPLVLSEYENAFRRPSQLNQRGVHSDVAGVNSQKMTQLQEVHKTAHLNRRAMWQSNSSPATTPRQRASTPPRTSGQVTRTATPPRAGSTTPPRGSTTPPRARTPPKGASPRTDAVEELCRRWEAWAQDISNAVEKGASLPPPPVPKATDTGVSSAMLRVLEASAFAAAALARGSMDAKKLNVDIKNLDTKLADREDEVLRLQNIVDDLEHSNEERCNSEANAKAHIKELEVAAQNNLAEINRLKKRGAELEKTLATESAERKEAERRLRLPCRGCEQAQLRLSDLGDEIENLKATLQDSEARRHKEVEDALQLADSAEAKYTQLMTVLRQVLASNGGAGGANADIMAGLSIPSVSRSGDKMVSSVATRSKVAATSQQNKDTRNVAPQVASGRTTPPRTRSPAPNSSLDKVRGTASQYTTSLQEKTTTSVERGSSDIGEEEAEAEPLDHLESSDYRDTPPTKAWPTAPSQRSSPQHDSPAPQRSPPQGRDPNPQATSRQYRDAPSDDVPSIGSSVHSTRRRPDLASSKAKASDSSGQNPRRPVPMDSSRGGPNTSAPSPDLSDATQRLEQEVVELCRALGGDSSDQRDSAERFDEDSEAKATARRRAKGLCR